MKSLKYILIIFLVIFQFESLAQIKISHDQGLKYFLNEKQTDFIQFKGGAQPWLRYLENNPGTLIDDNEKSNLTDLSFRRLRLGADGQLFEKLYFNIVFGGNNFNYHVSNKGKFHLLNLEMKYQIHPAFAIGIGKTNFGTISRYGAPSTSQILGLDIPIQAFPTVNTLDDLGRNWAIFGTGVFKNTNYQFAFSHSKLSFQEKNVSEVPGEEYNFSYDRHRLKISGYLKHQLFDRESCETPFSSGTHLGDGKYLNIGLGMSHQPDAMWKIDENNATVYHDLNLIAADLFLEMPAGKTNKSAITYYAAYFHYDFGDNYIRNIGINNPASGNNNDRVFNGSGNKYPAVGTGHDIYMQVGYLFGVNPNAKVNAKRFQVYGIVNRGNFEKLDDPVIVYEAGFNFYLNRQRSKLTVGYQNRPIFEYNEADVIAVTNRKSWVVLQYQIVIK